MLSVAALAAASGVPAMAETAPQRDSVGQTPQVSAEASEMVESGQYTEDKVIVVFNKDNVTDSRIKKEIKAEDAACLEIAEATDSAKVAVADIGENESVEEAITRLDANDKVLYAQPNYRYESFAAAETDDPYNNDDGQNQWYLTNIKARQAWQALPEADALEPVTVAVIDTGADVDHEDLKGQIHPSSKKIDGAEVTDLTKDSDSEGHGTHTSGLIGAAADNGKGIAGIASGLGNDKIKVLSIDATTQEDGELYFDTFNLVSAISCAKQNGAKVINMSLGGPGPDKITEEAVEDAYKSGITIVAAAGNEDTDQYMVPSDYGEVISVCNTTKEDKRYAGFMTASNFGQAKDISAPGAGILSTIPGGYANMTGTSMASPMVSAAAAVLYSINPDLTPFQVKNILCGTAADIGGEGFDYYTGYGLLNMEQAVEAAKSASTEIKATDISFKEDENYKKCIKAGESEMLEVLTAPAASLEAVTWSSSDPEVAAVDENGKVTGIKAGAAVITCTSASGQAAASQNVYVNESNLPTKVTVTNLEKLEKLAVGDMVYLETEVLPAYADGADVYWKSSDMKVATVDELGCLKARGTGTARIMAYVGSSSCKTFDDLETGSDDRTAVIEVSVGPAVSKVSLDNPQTKIKLGSSCSFQARIEPEDAANKDIIWSSSNRGVAQIDAETGQLTTVGVGKATIRAYSANGKSASVRITVYKTGYSGASYGLTAASSTYKSVKLKWKAIPNADGYEIWRGGKKIKNVSGTAVSWTETGLKTGKKYSYKIRAYYKIGDKTEYCGFSSVKSAKPALKAAQVKTKNGKAKITVTWSKVSGATGYTVYKYSASKKKYVKKKTLKKRTYTDTSVKKGRKYSYKVRAYRTVSGKKVYGPYSQKASRVYK